MRFLVTLGVRPDALTVLGAALFGGAAALFALGYVRLGGAGMLLAGILDALDGGVARESGSATRFGAFLDSTLDRLSESAVFVGIVYLYAASGRPAEALLAAAAMTFSLSTSYARARAEGLGVRCKVGLLERAGRIGILALSALAGLLPVGLALVALGAAVTTLQRILHVRRSTRDDETGRIASPSRRAPKP